jgi:hypothetical protein
MSIRTLKDFTISASGLKSSNGAWDSDWFHGVIVHVEDPRITPTPKTRRFCHCGTVNDITSDTEACPVCGNTNFYRASLGRYYRRDEKIHYNVPRFVDEKLCGVFMQVEYNTSTNHFEFTETFYEALSYNGTFYSTAAWNLDSDLYSKLFEIYISEKPNWDIERAIETRFPIEVVRSWNKQSETDYLIKIHLYNMLVGIPGIDRVTAELFEAVYKHFSQGQPIVTNGVESYYKTLNAPLVLKELYPVLGLPSNTNLAKFDDFNPAVISVISHALLHKRITYSELETMFRNTNADTVNYYGVDFSDFFRRNVVKHGSKTFEVYEHIKSLGADTLKEANLRKLSAYCKKKGVKTFPQAYDALIEGDGLKFLAYLAGELK